MSLHKFWQHSVEGCLRLTFILMNIHEHGVPHSANEIAPKLKFRYLIIHSTKCIRRIQVLLTCDPSTYKGVFFLNSCIFWSFPDIKTGKMALICLHHIHYVKRHFTFRATGYRSEFWNSTGSLKGQSEMILKWMSSDPNNAVKQLDLILMRLSNAIGCSWHENGSKRSMLHIP